MKLFNTYGESFAYWAPIMRTRHERTKATSLPFVKADINAALSAWDGDHTPYTGKLMAELDAVRDREHALRKSNRK